MTRNHNIAFDNSIAFLSHPLALSALIVLLLNDHFFRKVWPSWLFGKLGDLAWLFVFPAFLVVPLSFLVQNRSQTQARRVGAAAYALTAVVFASANLFSAVEGTLVRLLEDLLGTPIGLVGDPSDLLTLIALVFSWKRWQKSRLNEGLAWRGITAFSLVMLLTIANGPGPDVGIVCVEVQDDSVIAQSAYHKYSSSDGGYTWRDEEERQIPDCDYYINTECNIERPSFLEASIQGGEIIYRFQPCEGIEVSRDDGDSWKLANPLTQFSEAERVYYEAVREGAPSTRQGPFDAVFDEKTGNVIFAMGHQGILLLDETGVWRTVPVGAYIPYDAIGFFPKLLFVSGEAGLSIFAGLLLMNFMTLDIQRGRRRTILLTIAILIFFVNAIVFPPSVFWSNFGALFIMPSIVFGLILLYATIERMITLRRSHQVPLNFMLMLALSSVLIYFLPFVLWLINAIPYYHLALALSVFSLFLLYYAWKRRIKTDPAIVEERAPGE